MAKRVTQRALAERTGEKVLAVRYLRVSKMGDRVLDSAEFRSPDLQIEAIDREFDRQYGPEGWELVSVDGNFGPGTWADLDVSGQDERRAGLDAAMAAVDEHRAEVLGVLNLSRWARLVIGALRRMEELEEKGASLVSAEERTDMLTPTGKFATHMFLAIAELYANQKGEEWSRVIEQRGDEGLHHGRLPVAYVKLRDKVGQHIEPMVPDPDASETLVEAFERFDTGASKTSVGQFLRDAGLVSATSQAVPILSNRVYRRTHDASCPGTRCDERDPHGNCGEVRQWELAPGRNRRRIGEVWSPGQHEGIVDADLFDRVQARLDLLAVSGDRAREARHPLVGVVRCAACGRALACDYGGARVTMKCSSGKAIGCAGPGVVTADRILEDVALPAVADMAARVGRVRTTTAIDRRKPTAKRRRGPDTDTLRMQHATLIERIAEIETQVALGEYPGGRDEADTVIERLRERAAGILAKLAAATKLATPTEQVPSAQLVHVTENWDSLRVVEQNAALRALMCVYVGQRVQGAPFRQPYAERCVVRWSWVRD